MLVEKEKKVEKKPDYIGAAYFGVAAIYCVYVILSGEEYLPVPVVAPAFYMLLTVMCIGAIAYVCRLAASVFSSFKDSKKMKEEFEGVGQAVGDFLVMLIVAGILFKAVEPEKIGGFFDPYSLLLVAFSLLALAVRAFQKSSKEGALSLSKMHEAARALAIKPAISVVFVLIAFYFLVPAGREAYNIKWDALVSRLVGWWLVCWIGFALATKKDLLTYTGYARAIVCGTVCLFLLYLATSFVSNQQLAIVGIALVYAFLALAEFKGELD
ncbi:Uncharacterised protein [Candidatus Anstonella stagnisolia]|nr:Uncharacterised protein [Candidatus Anstonella stagnisolia]